MWKQRSNTGNGWGCWSTYSNRKLSVISLEKLLSTKRPSPTTIEDRFIVGNDMYIHWRSCVDAACFGMTHLRWFD